MERGRKKEGGEKVDREVGRDGWRQRMRGRGREWENGKETGDERRHRKREEEGGSEEYAGNGSKMEEEGETRG